MEHRFVYPGRIWKLGHLSRGARPPLPKAQFAADCRPTYDRLRVCGTSSEEVRKRDAYGDSQNAIAGPRGKPTIVGPMVQPPFICGMCAVMFWETHNRLAGLLVCFYSCLLSTSRFTNILPCSFGHRPHHITIQLVVNTSHNKLKKQVGYIVSHAVSEYHTFRMSKSFDIFDIYSLAAFISDMMQTNCIIIHIIFLHDLCIENRCDHFLRCRCLWPAFAESSYVNSHSSMAMSLNQLIKLKWFNRFFCFFGKGPARAHEGILKTSEQLGKFSALSPNLYINEVNLFSMFYGGFASHLRRPTKKIFTFCYAILKLHITRCNEFSICIGFKDSYVNLKSPINYHISNFSVPYYSFLIWSARLPLVRPPHSLIMINSVVRQVAFYEILAGMWVRNGLQIKGQAMTYIQCHFCNSMVDADLYLLQICAGELPPDNFIMTIMDRFHMLEWLSLSPCASNSFLENEHEITVMESCLTFLATLTTLRTNIGLSESGLAQLEMVTLLCMGDKTHSQLMEFMPEKCGTASQTRDFEAVLSKISSYRAPNYEASGTMQQGMYIPKDEVWEHYYDPIYVLLRAVQRRDFQGSLDRFKQYCKQSGHMNNFGTLWPPFRLPAPVANPYTDPQRVLGCRTFHAVILVLLYKALNSSSTTDHLLALSVYLLELAVEYQAQHCQQGGSVLAAQYFECVPEVEDDKPDGNFSKWFATDDIFTNALTNIARVHLNPTPSLSSASDGSLSGSDLEMEELEGGETRLALTGAERPTHPTRSLPAGSELVLWSQGASAMVPSGDDVPTTPDTPTHDLPPLALPPAGNSSVSPTSPVASPANMLIPLNINLGNTSQAALPGPGQYPFLLAGTEVGRRAARNSGITNSPRRMKYIKKTNFSRSGTPPKGAMRRLRRPAGGRAALPDPNTSDADATSASPTQSDMNHFPNLPSLDRTDEYVEVEESIISLLIKLHSKMTGKPNSYRPDFSKQREDSRIGDGPFFIAKVLNKIGSYDPGCRQSILQNITRIYHTNDEDSSYLSSEEEAKAREDKRKKAKERQRRVMEEFAFRQRQFMEQNKAAAAEAEASGNDSMEVEEECVEHHKEYDCVICNQSIPSTPERPVGLVVLLQATSVLGHRTTSREKLVVPTTDSERTKLKQQRYTLGQYMEEKADTLMRHFDTSSWMSSQNMGWEGGVRVQTCGHHLHLDCHQSYLLALHSQHRANNNSINVEKGEYWCPLCRQLGNAVLPISPEIGDLATLAKCSTSSDSEIVEEVDRLLSDLTVPTFSASLTKAMARMMEDMTVSTYPKYRNVASNPSPPSLFMFVSSILRTNLEVELVQRGGTLVNQAPDVQMDIKRSCLMPLLHVLGFHSKILSRGGDASSSAGCGGLGWIRQTWASVTQHIPDGTEGAVTAREREVPLLLRDPITMLLQLVLLLPSKIDLG
ncbi:unnamed protein product, partial [Meganyctiphanes norvegica]